MSIMHFFRARYVLALVACGMFAATPAVAHPPYGHEDQHQHVGSYDPDVVGAIQNHLPLSYRERYNRPRFVGGMFAYLVSPTSQEAMSWHEHVHRGTYLDHHAPPVCKKYYYPKPWEVLPIGPRNCGAAASGTVTPAVDLNGTDIIPQDPNALRDVAPDANTLPKP